MLARKVDRMERWIHEIAKQTGVKLSEAGGSGGTMNYGGNIPTALDGDIDDLIEKLQAAEHELQRQ